MLCNNLLNLKMNTFPFYLYGDNKYQYFHSDFRTVEEKPAVELCSLRNAYILSAGII